MIGEGAKPAEEGWRGSGGMDMLPPVGVGFGVECVDMLLVFISERRWEWCDKRDARLPW